MRVQAPIQNEILKILIRSNKPISLRQLTNFSSFTYYQVASCLGALRAKGYVRKVKNGIYEVTEDAKLMELSSETQIKILKNKVNELEHLLSSMLLKKSAG